MASICLLIAVCSLLAVQAQVPSIGKCPRVANEAGFNRQLFLGVWYEVEKYPLVTDVGGKCITNTFHELDANVMTVSNAQINRFTKNGSGYVGRITAMENGEMMISMPVPPFSITVDSPYWIIATDYIDYAVIFSCRQLTSFMMAEMIWILARSPQPSHATVHHAYRVLDRYRLSKTYLMHTDQTNCAAGNQTV